MIDHIDLSIELLNFQVIGFHIECDHRLLALGLALLLFDSGVWVQGLWGAEVEDVFDALAVFYLRV